ncbi:hypothetical protein DID73_00095 [Candidatus Marinamargulisbacteria bacterium SCGC AG-343-K17]|nr:hypothetical protein DID73_00095 [Candidatus Marinamargulisbacteria bacterium SCGC AG-343-K17]
MKRLLIGLFVLLFSLDGFAVLSYTGLTQINSGRVIRGEPTGALSFTVVSDGTDTLTSLKITSDSTDFHTTDQAKVTDLSLYFDDGDGVFDSGDSKISATTSDYTAGAVNTITFTINESITTTTKTILLVFTTGATIPITETMSIDVTEDNGGAITVSQASVDIVGVDSVFTDLSGVTKLIYDADATKFSMLQFQLTPDSEGYFIENVIISNSESSFDSTGSNNGVSGLYLYKESSGAGFSKDDDTLLKSITNVSSDPVTFNSTSTAMFSFTSSDGDNRKITTATTFYVVVDLGPSTNIEVNDTQVKVNAKVTSLSGTGVNSSYSYGPINISGNDFNNRSVPLAGMVIKSIENIFPSMNAAAGLTDIPILKFVAKSVGETTRLKSLVISNDSKTFDLNGSGITALKWVVDDSGGEYSGYGIDGPGSSPELDSLLGAAFAINDSSKGTFTYDNPEVDIASGVEKTFYILADFGLNMSSGQSVSLNISVDTRANHAVKGDIRIGSALPLTVTPTQSITLVDPQLIIKTQLDAQIDTDNDGAGDTSVGLFCDTDLDDTCDAGAVEKLVAGMYDLRMYVMDIDVSTALTGVSFEFQSPNRYFSQESIGISQLSLYLDKDKNGVLGAGDIFLGSTKAFTNSGKTATVSNISLPQGKDQKVLVLFDIGQRVSSSSDQLSIQLSNVTVSGNVAAGLLPNPITPYTYDVDPHKLNLKSLTSDIADDNVITQASTFDVTAIVKPLHAVHTIQLVQVDATGVPLSMPKFYLGGVSGSNRSYEFTQTFNEGASFDAGTLFGNHTLGTEINLQYQVSAANITSEGNYLIDFDIYYQMTHTDYLQGRNIRFTRSKGAGTDYKSVLDLSTGSTSNNIEPSMTTTNKVYTWSLPSYIESVEVKVNNKFVAFNNYQSTPQNSQLKITFVNNGDDIDKDSLALQLNGTTVKTEAQVVDSSDIYYEYDALSGELLLSSVGSSSGTLTVSANDNFGQAYPSAPLIFFTSSELEIEKFLVYPNPFSPSITSSGVTFGFSLTQSASVSIKVYDAMGREISQVPPQTFAMGYRTISWNAIITSSSKFIPSGTYYLKLTATDDNGATKVATTKMAVY